IVVSLGKDWTVDSVLRPAAKESVVVTAEAPVVDTTSSGLGTNLSTRSIETLPTGRNYSAITQVVPGVSSDADPRNPTQNTITVYASAGAATSFFLDAVNTSGVADRLQVKN